MTFYNLTYRADRRPQPNCIFVTVKTDDPDKMTLQRRLMEAGTLTLDQVYSNKAMDGRHRIITSIRPTVFNADDFLTVSFAQAGLFLTMNGEAA